MKTSESYFSFSFGIIITLCAVAMSIFIENKQSKNYQINTDVVTCPTALGSLQTGCFYISFTLHPGDSTDITDKDFDIIQASNSDSLWVTGDNIQYQGSNGQRTWWSTKKINSVTISNIGDKPITVYIYKIKKE